MNELDILGKLLVTVGLLTIACGGMLTLAGRFFRGGRLLPGGAFIEKGNLTYFPIVTCLVVRVTLTLVQQFARWLRR